MSCNNTESCRGCFPSTLRELGPDQRFCSTFQMPVSELMPTCAGCRADQPNQLAHMDPGGCLYVDEEEAVWETESENSEPEDEDYGDESMIRALAEEIRRDQDTALEAGTQRLLDAYSSEPGDSEPEEEDPEKPKVDVSKPLVAPLFALPCGFAFPECAICYEPIEMVNVAVTTCGHAFHASCAFRALDRADCCPMCRHQLVDEPPEEDEEESEGGEDEDDEDEEESQDGEEEVAKVSLEQLTGKLTNMGYTMADIIRSLVHVKSETNEAKYTEERDDKLHADMWGIMEGEITLAHRDARSYAAVVATPKAQPVVAFGAAGGGLVI